MSEIPITDDPKPSTPPEPVFRKRLKRRITPMVTAADKFALARNILRYVFFAALAGIAVLLGFAFCADGGQFWRVAGGLVLFAFAAVAAGALTGFLFGIPRTLQGNAAAESTSYQVNTNLEQISDWLTKIIVGLGLINLKQIPGHVMTMNRYVSSSLDLKPPAFAVVGATGVFFAAVGFLLGYLATRLFISGAFREADVELLRRFADAAESPAKAGAQPREEPEEKPVDARVTKLIEVAEKTDASPATVTPDVARKLALAYTTAGEFERAVPFFERAGAPRTDDNELALEYAYALGESGRRQEAVAFLEDLFARKSLPEAARLLGYFFLWFPEHLEKSVGWTQLYLDKTPKDSGAIFNLACAYAQLYGRTRDAAYLQKSIATLQEAISLNDGWRERAKQLRRDDFASLADSEFAKAIA